MHTDSAARLAAVHHRKQQIKYYTFGTARRIGWTSRTKTSVCIGVYLWFHNLRLALP